MLYCTVSALLFLSLISLIRARPEFKQLIPNGEDAFQNPDSGITCEYLGHENCEEGAPRNPFGLDFKEQGLQWTKELCEMDSDEDGLTNGEELGDPCCVWEEGEAPDRRTMLSHPGDPSETGATSAPKCDRAPTPLPAESPPVSPSATPSATPALSLPAVTDPDFTSIDDDDAVCFPAHATVTLEDGRTREMRHLRIGDRVQVAQGVYSNVFMFTHKVKETKHEFVIIRAGSEDGVAVAVTLTKGHLMYVNGKLERAGDVRVGDEVELVNQERCRVVAVECARFKGLYNPQTQHGDLIVDGVRVSTYTTAVKVGSAHSLLAPVRIVYEMFGWTSSMLEQGADRIAALLP